MNIDGVYHQGLELPPKVRSGFACDCLGFRNRQLRGTSASTTRTELRHVLLLRQQPLGEPQKTADARQVTWHGRCQVRKADSRAVRSRRLKADFHMQEDRAAFSRNGHVNVTTP